MLHRIVFCSLSKFILIFTPKSFIGLASVGYENFATLIVGVKVFIMIRSNYNLVFYSNLKFSLDFKLKNFRIIHPVQFKNFMVAFRSKQSS